METEKTVARIVIVLKALIRVLVGKRMLHDVTADTLTDMLDGTAKQKR